MKVLIINVSSNQGSTGKITSGLQQYLLEKGHDVIVCCRGVVEQNFQKGVVTLCSKLEFYISVFLARLTGLESHFSYFATWKLIGIIKRFEPDVIQLYNIHGNYIRAYSLLKFLKTKGIPVVYSMLDEFPYMGKCAYPVECERFKEECRNCPQKGKYPESWFFDQSNRLFYKKEKIYDGFKNILFTGPPYVCQRAKESHLLRNMKSVVLYEPFNFTDYFYPRNTEKLRIELGIKESDRVIVCASGTYFRKGGHFFVEVAAKLKDVEDIKFIFIGYDRDNWKFTDNMIVKGRIYDQNLFAEYMSLADAYVCTSVGDTTPSVCLCALGCGTPLIGFDYGGVKDCAPISFGTYVTMKDVNALAEAIKNCRHKTQEDITAIRKYAISRFSQDSVYSQQLELYNKIIKGEK